MTIKYLAMDWEWPADTSFRPYAKVYFHLKPEATAEATWEKYRDLIEKVDKVLDSKVDV